MPLRVQQDRSGVNRGGGPCGSLTSECGGQVRAAAIGRPHAIPPLLPPLFLTHMPYHITSLSPCVPGCTTHPTTPHCTYHLSVFNIYTHLHACTPLCSCVWLYHSPRHTTPHCTYHLSAFYTHHTTLSLYVWLYHSPQHTTLHIPLLPLIDSMN